jgi:hypothetical protein
VGTRTASRSLITALITALLLSLAASSASAQTVGYDLDPNQGPLGTVVTVSGSGCPPSGGGFGDDPDADGVFVFAWLPEGNFSGQFQRTFTTSADGTFSFTFTVGDGDRFGLVRSGVTYDTGLICLAGGDVGWPGEPGRPFTVTGSQQVDFPDVPVGNVHRDAILELARDGILRGGVDGLFRPADPITRGQVAAVLARTAGLTPVTPSRFPDVAGSVHAGDIEALAAAGIIDGYADGTFRPLEPIRRDHVAALVARWLGVEPVADGPFTDIARTPHAGAINALYELGVVNGRTASTFAPSLDIRRDQFASVVSRARPLAD